MSSIMTPNVLTFKVDGAIAKGKCVKAGSDSKHVAVSAAATSKNFGIAINATTTAEDKVEVALPGGGAKALLNGVAAFGDLLVPDSTGAFIVTTTPGDRVVAMALEDGVAGDLISSLCLIQLI